MTAPGPYRRRAVDGRSQLSGGGGGPVGRPRVDVPREPDDAKPSSDGDLVPVSAAFLRAVLDESPDLVAVVAADGACRLLNRRGEELLGSSAATLSGSGAVLAIIHPQDRAGAAAALEAVLGGAAAARGAGDATPPLALRARAGDGTWHHLEATLCDLRGDPFVAGVLVRATDRTGEQRSVELRREQERRLDVLVDSLPIAALLEDADRSIIAANEEFVELFEVSCRPAELIGRRLADLGEHLSWRFGDPTVGPGEERLERILAARQPVVGDRIPLADGRVLERDYAPVLVDREYRGHVFLFRDVSDQAQTEAEWERLLESQSEENRKLVELDKLKSDFLAELSHELRTPLTSILSFTELLRDGLGRDRTADQAEFVDTIARNAGRLLRLLDDLVLLDRIEVGELPLQWGAFDVPTLVASAVTSFTPSADRKGVSLESEVGEGPPLWGDSQRIGQLIDVLLSNAIKFTNGGGRVLVTAAHARDRWLIEVADTGIGIPPAEGESLFERFYRASNARAARVPGSGLGLAVAQAIVDLHGGSIRIGAGAPRGTVVSVHLPPPRGITQA